MSRKVKRAAAGLIAVAALVTVVFVWGRSRPALAFDPKNPLGTPIVIRSNGEFLTAQQLADKDFKEAFPKIDRGESLTQADRTNLLTGARWCAAMADYLPGRADAEKEDFRCGQALAALGYHEAAIRRFDMYISYAGEHPVDQNTAVIRADSYNLRGASLMELGDLKGALDSVNQAVKAFPDAPFFRYVRAAVELRLNDSKAAIQDLDVAVTKGQEQQDPVTLRAYALLEGVKAKMKSEK